MAHVQKKKKDIKSHLRVWRLSIFIKLVVFCRPSCRKLQFVIQQDLALCAFEHIYNTNSDIVYASSKQK